MVYTDIHMSMLGFIALDWSLMLFALLVIILRLSVRFHRSKSSPPPSKAAILSDAFIVMAWLSGMVLISINTWKNNLRRKYQHWDPKLIYYGVPHDMAGHLLYVCWVSLFFIYISLYFAKAAFIAFYYDLFSAYSSRMRYWLMGTSVFTGVTFLVQMSLLVAWCNPVSSNWDVDGHLCSAVHSIKSVTIATFTNVATDLLILAIPLTLLGSLTRTYSLRRRELSGLLFVFFIGSLSVTAALARFVTLSLVQKVPKANITHTIDVWALAEIVTSIIAVSLPSMRVFLRRRRGSGSNGMFGSERGDSVGSKFSANKELKPLETESESEVESLRKPPMAYV